ncbi:hypothetical protein [Haloferula sp.]|uniref:hypothetical protein n=1 Tax=Haloferula sp. TaxID=2497595 RepID=UPI003C731C74
MAETVQQFIDKLTPNHRVIIIGGVAVIGHGMSRHTKDADIWLEPLHHAKAWADVVDSVCRQVPGTSIHRLPGWIEVRGSEIAHAAEETGMVRIHGLNVPLDIFRKPNEFDESVFDAVAKRAKRNDDGTLLPEPLDLVQTKMNTVRDHDQQDILFLESLVRADYKKRLPVATIEEATAMLNRYSEWQVLQAALENPSEQVRALAHQHLREFAEAGDPFSQAILEGREIP